MTTEQTIMATSTTKLIHSFASHLLHSAQLRFEEMENRVVEAESLVEEQNEGERAKRASLDEGRRAYSRWIPRNGYRHNGYIHY